MTKAMHIKTSAKTATANVSVSSDEILLHDFSMMN